MYKASIHKIYSTLNLFSKTGNRQRLLFLLIPVLVFQVSFAQNKTKNFGSIDWKVRNIEANSVDSLASRLTSPYQTDIEKVRAIFSWITQNISYNTNVLSSSRRYHPIKFLPEPVDTVSVWKSAYEMTAERVLKRRYAVCDGYAKLFKTLCDYSGIQSEVITGYAKNGMERSIRFRTNHTWNAVMIDSVWHLLDVTWASGYVNYGEEFVQRTDETYFLSSPKQFFTDHYPEDLRWTLLDNPPAVQEFKFTPFKCKSYIKYGISSFFPRNGLIEASIGDTVRIDLETYNSERDMKTSSDPFFDSSILTMSPASAFLTPSVKSNTISYTYVVDGTNVEWLHLMYNDDMILRYKLNVRKEKD
jgi:hypothetical protein